MTRSALAPAVRAAALAVVLALACAVPAARAAPYVYVGSPRHGGVPVRGRCRRAALAALDPVDRRSGGEPGRGHAGREVRLRRHAGRRRTVRHPRRRSAHAEEPAGDPHREPAARDRGQPGRQVGLRLAVRERRRAVRHRGGGRDARTEGHADAADHRRVRRRRGLARRQVRLRRVPEADSGRVRGGRPVHRRRGRRARAEEPADGERGPRAERRRRGEPGRQVVLRRELRQPDDLAVRHRRRRPADGEVRRRGRGGRHARARSR